MTIALAGRIEYIEVERKLSAERRCDGDRMRPDIVLVLSESQTSPEFLSPLGLPQAFVDSYRPADGKIYTMNVETFGGGTWQTNFSVMTGLSTADFGWQAPYVTQIMENRIGDSLPQALAACGYRTISILPMPFNFVNEENFHQSIGFETVHDSSAIGLTEERPRDAVIFDFVRKVLHEHRKQDPRPVFIALQTMHSHGPYADNPGGMHADIAALTDDPELKHYLSRVAAARDDLVSFRDWLGREPGARGTVFLEFGDHQSSATRTLLEGREQGRNLYADFRSLVYRTYYSVLAFGTPLDLSHLRGDEDAAFLMARLTAAAGLPNSATLHALRDLGDSCAGLFHACPERALVNQFIASRSAVVPAIFLPRMLTIRKP